LKKIIIILTLFSIAVSQGKMILKTGEEIVLKEKINLSDFNSNSSYINQNSKYYSKSKVALAVSSEGEILFRSGMSISKYNSLSIVKKAKADNKFSSVGFKNINNDLISTLNNQDRELYLNTYENYNYIDYKGCIFKTLGAFGIISLIAVIDFMQTGFGF
tara:strand:+ start:48 stop:527 length:480 start_codon:yes stop_codon:yes gene_type:complete